jgi:two-component sensor histidine kinase
MLYCNRHTGKVTHIYETGTGKNNLSATTITCGVFNRYNNLWFSTGSQLQVMDNATHQILANHDVAHGLPSMTINALTADSSGRIWANTPAGLTMFNPRSKYWLLYNRYDGMEKDYLDGELAITANQQIAIGQVNGIILKNLDQLSITGKEPELKITGIIVNNRLLPDSLLLQNNNRFNLPYDQNNIAIEFAAMDWLYPFKTTYTYWIEGHRQANTDNDGRLGLTGLSPGRYTVHIRAINNGGEWSNEVVITFIIRQPFWKTAWFIALCILCGLGILYTLYRYRIRQLKQLHEMRNNISNNLHDDIGASLSNIHILNELAKRNKDNPGKTVEYLDKAGEDIQSISESLSDIVWNINPRYDNFDNLLIRMKRYAAEMMDGRNINYEIQFPNDTDLIRLNMDKRRDLYLIFKEAVNNLVKYSAATDARIAMRINNRHLVLDISDNGRGFEPAAIKEGNGLLNMKQRAEKWKGRLNMESNTGKGTHIELLLPL